MTYKKQIKQRRNKTVSLKELNQTKNLDYNFKIKNAKKFISKGDKVKFTVKFKGREMQYTDLGKELMNKIINEVKDIAKVEASLNLRKTNGYDHSAHLKRSISDLLRLTVAYIKPDIYAKTQNQKLCKKKI